MPIELDYPRLHKTAEEADRVKTWKNGYDKGWRDGLSEAARIIMERDPTSVGFHHAEAIRQIER